MQPSVEGWPLFVCPSAYPIHLPVLGPHPSENVIYTCVTEWYMAWPTILPTSLSILVAVRPRAGGLLAPNASLASLLRAGC